MVASWEFWSLAVMLIGTHGDEAEAEAQRRFDESSPDEAGQRVTWSEVLKKIPAVRADQDKIARSE
jgi:hypothetical protein